MEPPTPAEQIRFLTNVQRLLAEGLFTATYKYALLAALADLSVESGDDSGRALPMSTFAIAEKFVEYYWRHAMPYATANDARVLRQNTGNTAKVISLILEAQKQHGESLASLMRDRHAWKRLVRKVEAVVKQMPLWKLQTVGKEKLEFLYGETEQDGSIELRPGVAYCFRQFYSLIQDALRSAWLRDVRSLNGDLLGETLDLREFLFGAERNALAVVRPVLMNLQHGKCFYCGQPVRRDGGHVDHFIPWTKYPIDLGHNFVLADSACNGKKRDRIAHVDHLAKWSERNREYGAEIASALKDQFPCDLACTNRVAHWAYSQTEAANGLTWVRGDELRALSEEWRNYINPVAL
ncbi:MAG TPA: HNH endonuclease signature motif containing protein [Candidatus Binataceae bacterium]|nr:HNH endonuclease signature motif containing protein [Candidatus Binataceae bacterium]